MSLLNTAEALLRPAKISPTSSRGTIAISTPTRLGERLRNRHGGAGKFPKMAMARSDRENSQKKRTPTTCRRSSDSPTLMKNNLRLPA